MKYRYNNVWLGLILGIVVPFFAITFFQLSNFRHLPFVEFYKYMYSIDVLSKLFSLCGVPNLLLFFIFIWKNLLYSARGVIMATAILAFAVVFIKFVI